MKILRCILAQANGILFVSLLLVNLAGCDAASNKPETVGLAIVIVLTMLVASLAAGAIPLLGIGARENLLRWATSLAAGFLISSALLVAMPEGFHMVSGAEEGSHVYQSDQEQHAKGLFGFGPHQAAGIALLAGFMLMLVFESMGFGHDLHEEHHQEGSTKDHIHHPAAEALEGQGLATSIVIGLSIHALTDGFAIGAALATGSASLTTPLMLGIIMHKMPAAFSLSAFSQHSHGSVRRTWQELIIFSLATPLALLIAWQILGNLERYWLGLAVLASAGTFLYVATVDVLPNVIHGGNRKMVLLQVFIGTSVIFLLLFVLQSLGLATHLH